MGQKRLRRPLKPLQTTPPVSPRNAGRRQGALEAHEKQNFFQRLSLGSPSSRSAHLPPAEAAIEKAAVREDETFVPGPVPDEALCVSSERRAPRGLGSS